MKVDAATSEVTGVNLALRNSSVCAQEGGGQEEGDRTLFPSYTRESPHTWRVFLSRTQAPCSRWAIRTNLGFLHWTPREMWGSAP